MRAIFTLAVAIFVLTGGSEAILKRAVYEAKKAVAIKLIEHRNRSLGDMARRMTAAKRR